MGSRKRRKSKAPPQKVAAPSRPGQSGEAPPGSVAISAIAQKSFFQGPLPPPEALAKYNEAFPGAAQRIMVLAEGQSAHRQLIEAKVLDSNVRNERAGQWMAFAIALVVTGGGLLLILQGKNIEGFTAMLTPVAGLVALFIYADRRKQKTLLQKWRELLSPPDA